MSQKPRGVLIAGNWKMNYGPKEAADFVRSLEASLKGGLRKSTDPVVCLIPPYVSLSAVVEAAKRLGVHVAAQNAHWEKKGAFTGEISGPMLEELGVKWVLIGHSERRQLFGETDETAKKRTESLLAQGFRVILCVGETKDQRNQNQTEIVIAQQISAVLSEPANGAAAFLDGRLVLAYEPVWAIGTGLTATPAQAEDAHQFIRKLLWDRFGMQASGRTPILYGGSVTPENIDQLLACPNVDGALVGGASLKPESFLALIKSAQKSLA